MSETEQLIMRSLFKKLNQILAHLLPTTPWFG